jgi:hypothetical protein
VRQATGWKSYLEWLEFTSLKLERVIFPRIRFVARFSVEATTTIHHFRQE